MTRTLGDMKGASLSSLLTIANGSFEGYMKRMRKPFPKQARALSKVKKLIEDAAQLNNTDVRFPKVVAGMMTEVIHDLRGTKQTWQKIKKLAVKHAKEAKYEQAYEQLVRKTVREPNHRRTDDSTERPSRPKVFPKARTDFSPQAASLFHYVCAHVPTHSLPPGTCYGCAYVGKQTEPRSHSMRDCPNREAVLQKARAAGFQG